MITKGTLLISIISILALINGLKWFFKSRPDFLTYEKLSDKSESVEEEEEETEETFVDGFEVGEDDSLYFSRFNSSNYYELFSININDKITKQLIPQNFDISDFSSSFSISAQGRALLYRPSGSVDLKLVKPAKATRTIPISSRKMKLLEYQLVSDGDGNDLILLNYEVPDRDPPMFQVSLIANDNNKMKHIARSKFRVESHLNPKSVFLFMQTNEDHGIANQDGHYQLCKFNLSNFDEIDCRPFRHRYANFLGVSPDSRYFAYTAYSNKTHNTSIFIGDFERKWRAPAEYKLYSSETELTISGTPTLIKWTASGVLFLSVSVYKQPDNVLFGLRMTIRNGKLIPIRNAEGKLIYAQSGK